jgi:hypothetical protein
MGIFHLKENDTRPTLDVLLTNPDGSAFDLTGYSTIKLYIKLNTGTILSRDMTVVGAPTAGYVRYTWLSTDWGTDKLIAGPSLPFAPSDTEHQMEYEVVIGAARSTFPNDGYDTLRILPDFA